jgi:hypothetical protein
MTYMESRKALGTAVAFFMGCLAAFPVHATFHIVQIQEVMAGANGNPAIQFIELTMLGPIENCQHSEDYDPESPKFRCLDESGPPDFSAARLCRRGADPHAARHTECLSYGAFAGDSEGFGSPAPALPITGAVSLRRVNSTVNNAADFVLSTPAPCANTGAGQCDTDVGVTQSRLIGPAPVGNKLAYILTVANNGPALAAKVTLDRTSSEGPT